MKSVLRFAGDRRGSVAIMTAMSMIVILGFTALAIDVGSFYLRKREQQTATDLAALVAAADIPNAQRAATATLAQNGVDATALQSVELGTYTADASIAPAKRFQVTKTATPNAVRLTVRTAAPMMFGSIFFINPASADTVSPNSAGGVPVRTVSVGTQANFASVAIGSRVASLNAGLLNSLLGQTLGSTVSLSLVDYQSLASANIDLFKFSKALATRANLTAVTFGQLGSASVRVGDVFGALADAATAGGQSSAAVSALTRLAGSMTGTFATMSIDPLVSFGPFAGMPDTAQLPLAPSVSALDIVRAAAEIAGKNSLITVPLSLNVPGITSASLQLAVGERPVGASFVGMGPTGTTVATAQTRLLVTVSLSGTFPVPSVSVPIYLNLAAATATLNSLQCGPSATAPSLTLGVAPSLVDAWIGSVPNSAFLAFGSTPAVQPATLVNVLNLFTVTGQAHASIANMATTAVPFSATDIAVQTKHTTSTTDFLTPLITSLDDNLQLSVQLGPLNLYPTSLIQQSVAGTIAAATNPIDQLLVQVLQTLGLGVGQADTWVTGVRCGGGVLVN